MPRTDRRPARSRSTGCPTSSSHSTTAPTTISPASRCSTGSATLDLPSGVTPVDLAAVLALRPDLPLRAAKPRPLADGAEDLRGLGRRAAIPSPCPAWRTTPASAAATMQYQVLLDPAQDRRGRPVGAAGGERAGGQQRQCRRRLLFAGRPVLLRARPGPARDAGGHRQRRAGGARRHAGAGQGRRPRGHRHRAAPRRVRLSRIRTTPWRASSCCAPARRRRTCCKRVEAKTQELNDTILPKDVKVHPVLRPQRPDRADHAASCERQPAARHAAGGRGADLLPLRLPRRADRRRHASRWRCCSPSSASICRTPRPTCCRSARWISASWSMARC